MSEIQASVGPNHVDVWLSCDVLVLVLIDVVALNRAHLVL